MEITKNPVPSKANIYCAGCKAQITLAEAVPFTRPAKPTMQDMTLGHTKWHAECLTNYFANDERQ